MILKLSGGFLLLLGSVGFGLKLCWEIRERERLLRIWERVFTILEGEMRSCRATVPEGLSAAGKKVDEEIGILLNRIAVQAEENRGLSLETIWKKEMEAWIRTTPMTQGEGMLLLDFPSHLGFMDSRMQATEISRFIQELAEAVQKAAEEKGCREKLIRSVSITAGLLLLLLLW